MKRIALGFALLVSIGAARADEGAFNLDIGADVSSGRYGSDTTTEIWSIPLSMQYSTGAWSFGGSLPWLRVSGDAGVLTQLGVTNDRLQQALSQRGIDRTCRRNCSTSTVQNLESQVSSGIGDLNLFATYSIATQSGMGFDIGANYKVATADEDEFLGTGKNDYGMSFGWSGEFGERTRLFAGVGYTHLGETDFLDEEGVADANIGASVSFAGNDELGVTYQWTQSAVSGSDHGRDAAMYYSHRLGESGSLAVNLGGGLSDSSSDWSAGVHYSHDF